MPVGGLRVADRWTLLATLGGPRHCTRVSLPHAARGPPFSRACRQARVSCWRVCMTSMLNRAKQFLVSEDGPTATEYAVMLALIIIVALAAITQLGEKVSTVFTNVESELPDGSA